MYYGQPFLEISVPNGASGQGRPRYLKHGTRDRRPLELNAVHRRRALRNSVTTFVEYGSQSSVQDALPPRLSGSAAALSHAGLRLRALGGG
jgi:hypothetical protein